MAYVAKTNWVNNDIVDAAAINKIEQGIKDVSESNALKAPVNNPTFTGSVAVPVPVNPTDAAQLKNITDISNQVLKTTSSPTFAGMTLTGPVTVQEPSAPNAPATKQFVENNVTQALKPVSSPTFAGLTLTGPASVQDASAAENPLTKGQFDAKVGQDVRSSASPTFAGATINGTLTATKVVGAVYG